jgi:hypothetical protein
MKTKLLITSLALTLTAAVQAQLFIGFESAEGYNTGALAGQPSSGTEWSSLIGSDSINVADSIGLGGTRGITGTTSASNFAFYGFSTTNSDLGITFDENSTVLQYSFQWRPTQDLDAGTSRDIFTFAIGGTAGNTTGTDSASTFRVRSDNRVSSTSGTTALLTGTGIFTTNQWATISGTVDYGSKTFTIFVDDTQLFTTTNGGNLSFRDANASSAYIHMGNLNGASNAADYRTWNADNISIVPEPSAYALLGGVMALAAVLIVRRRR